jgi:hypothetical protein
VREQSGWNKSFETFMAPVCLSNRWLFPGRSGGEHHFCDATDRAAKQNVGNDCQYQSRNQQFQDVDAPVNDELVYPVQNCGEKENLSDILPSLSQQFGAVGRIPKNCPKEGRSILMCIPEAGTNRENHCNCGLYDEPEIHRPRQSGVEVLPDPCKDVVHAVTVSDRDFFNDAAGSGSAENIFTPSPFVSDGRKF